MSRLLRDVKNNCVDPERATRVVSEHVLTPSLCEDIPSHLGGDREDDTRLHVGGAPLKSAEWVDMCPSRLMREGLRYELIEHLCDKPPRVLHRRHHRLLFKEVATPLHRVSSLTAFLKALLDCAEGTFLSYSLSLSLSTTN